METRVRFQWVKKTEELWLGIIEITGHYEMETFRVKIEKQVVDSYVFYHYKFLRFNYDKREWTMDAIKSNYPLEFFRALEDIYMEHIDINNTENVLITYKAIDKNRNRRMKIYRYFCKKLEEIGYVFVEHEEPTFSALLCFKNKDLVSLNNTNKLNSYLNIALARFEFYY